jgi:transcriptional regulator with XRE-family HTH domain
MGRTYRKPCTFGEVSRNRRRTFGYTQHAFARRIGVKASHVAYLENGRRRQSLRLLLPIAKELNFEKRRLALLAYPERAEFIGTE